MCVRNFHSCETRSSHLSLFPSMLHLHFPHTALMFYLYNPLRCSKQARWHSITSFSPAIQNGATNAVVPAKAIGCHVHANLHFISDTNANVGRLQVSAARSPDVQSLVLHCSWHFLSSSLMTTCTFRSPPLLSLCDLKKSNCDEKKRDKSESLRGFSS